MKFTKLVLYDIKHGLLKKWKWCIGILLMNFCFCLIFLMKAVTYNKGADIIGDVAPVVPTFGDAVFYIFAGMSEYTPLPDQPFRLPFIWILLYIVLLWVTLEYASDDLTSSGQQLLIRTKGRTAWWLSKCIWNFLCVLSFFVLMWGEILLFCVAQGFKVSLSLHATFLASIVPGVLGGSGYLLPLLLSLFVITPLIMYALSMLQMVLTLWLKPIISYAICVGILTISAYAFSPLFIGNYAMPVRNSAFFGGGVSNTAGLWFAIVLIAISVIMGIFRFRKYDILPVE